MTLEPVHIDATYVSQCTELAVTVLAERHFEQAMTRHRLHDHQVLAVTGPTVYPTPD